VRQAIVEAGWTTTDFSLEIGDVKESITVDGATPLIQYDSDTVGGLSPRKKSRGCRSTDAVFSNSLNFSGRAAADASALYLAMPGGLLRSTDRGKSWSDVSAGLTQLPGRLAFDAAHPDTVHAATSAGVFVITLDRNCFMDSC
jgi:hypothetical protein